MDELCERLGFLPLGLEQAAAYMAQNRVSVTQYLMLLDAVPAEMFAEAAEDTLQERTMAQVWAVTLDALADEPLTGRVLQVLAWLSPEGVPRELLTGMDSERKVLRAIGRLATYSMVTVDDQGSVKVHRLVQAVARVGMVGKLHHDPPTPANARNEAAGLLRAAIPGASDELDFWPQWRELSAQVAVFAGHAPAHADSIAVCYLLDCTARFLMEQGLLKQAVGYLQRAVDGYERLLGSDDPRTLASRNNLSGAYDAVGDYAAAIELGKKTLADRARVLGPDHPATLTSRNNLASAYREIGNYARAIELGEQTLADRERVLGPADRATLKSRNNLASAYLAAGDTALAIELHQRTLADRERVLGPDHPDTLGSRHNLAAAYLRGGDFTRAIEFGEKSLSDSERLLGPDHPRIFPIRNNLASAYLAAGDTALAIELHQRTLADRERVLGPDHPDTLGSRHNLADTLRAAGNFAQAIELGKRNLGDYQRLLGPNHPDVLAARNTLAAIYFAIEDYLRAIELGEKSLADSERLLGPDHPITLILRNNLMLARDRASHSNGQPD